MTRAPTAFQAIALLRGLRALEKRHLHFLTTAEDRDLVYEIGYHQGRGAPLGMKQLLLLHIASVATVQRRLRRMRHLGFLCCDRSVRDRRVVEVTLSPRLLRAYARCARAFDDLRAAA